MSGLTYIFLGLDTTDTVEQDIQTSGEDSLVLGGPGHCVGFTWGGDSIGKQQAYNTTNPEVILSWILVFKPCTSMLNAKYLIFFTLRLMNSFNTNTCNKRKMSKQEFFYSALIFKLLAQKENWFIYFNSEQCYNNKMWARCVFTIFAAEKIVH